MSPDLRRLLREIDILVFEIEREKMLVAAARDAALRALSTVTEEKA